MLRLVRPVAAPCARPAFLRPPTMRLVPSPVRSMEPPRSAFCPALQPSLPRTRISAPLPSFRTCLLLRPRILSPRRYFASPSSNSSKPQQPSPPRSSQNNQAHAEKQLLEVTLSADARGLTLCLAGAKPVVVDLPRSNCAIHGVPLVSSGPFLSAVLPGATSFLPVKASKLALIIV